MAPCVWPPRTEGPAGRRGLGASVRGGYRSETAGDTVDDDGECQVQSHSTVKNCQHPVRRRSGVRTPPCEGFPSDEHQPKKDTLVQTYEPGRKEVTDGSRILWSSRWNGGKPPRLMPGRVSMSPVCVQPRLLRHVIPTAVPALRLKLGYLQKVVGWAMGEMGRS